jgi:hypothetical protein
VPIDPEPNPFRPTAPVDEDVPMDEEEEEDERVERDVNN